VQHTGEIDMENPLEMLWVFGTPTQSLDGFTQARISVDAADAGVHAAEGVSVQVFGDADAVKVHAP
jgi:hypothetical protein